MYMHACSVCGTLIGKKVMGLELTTFRSRAQVLATSDPHPLMMQMLEGAIRVSSSGGGGGEASPPKHPASPPKGKGKKKKRRERERERRKRESVKVCMFLVL